MTSNDYNLVNPGACMTGFWEEERILKQDGLASRVYGKDMQKADSFERVMPRCRASDTMRTSKSATVDQMTAVLQPSQAPTAPPRGAQRDLAIAAESQAFVSTQWAQKSAYQYTGEAVSETMNRYHVPYDVGAYGVAQGLAAARDAQRSPGKNLPPPLPPGMAKGNPSAYSAGHYSTAPIITAFCSRLPELVFPYSAGSSRGHAGPGMEHAVQLHGAEGVEGLPYHLVAPGAELSLAPLFQKLVSRLEGVGLTLAAFVERLQGAVAEGSLERVCEGRKVGLGPMAKTLASKNPHKGNPEFVRADVFRLFVHSLKMPLADTDLEGIVRMCRPPQKDNEEPVVSLNLLIRVSHLVKSVQQ